MRFWVYVLKASWRIAAGRLYVWRDAPTDIVRQVAALWYLNRKHGEEYSEVIREAYKEHKLRKARSNT